MARPTTAISAGCASGQSSPIGWGSSLEIDEQREWRVGAERRSPGERFEEHDADGVQVAGWARGLAGESFGCEVRGSPEHQPGRGLIRIFREFGDAEVGDLRLPVGSEQNVARLDVSMNDTELVGSGERGENLDHERACSRRVERPLGQLVGERVTGEPFHDDVGHAVVFADVIDRDDVGVGDPGRGACFACESASLPGLLGKVGT